MCGAVDEVESDPFPRIAAHELAADDAALTTDHDASHAAGFYVRVDELRGKDHGSHAVRVGFGGLRGSRNLRLARQGPLEHEAALLVGLSCGSARDHAGITILVPIHAERHFLVHACDVLPT